MIDDNEFGNDNLNNGILSASYSDGSDQDSSAENNSYSEPKEERGGYESRAQRYQRSRRGGAYRTPRGVERGRGREKPKSGFGFLGVQTVVCILALLVAFALSLTKSSVFNQTKTYVTQALSKSVTAEQVSEVFANIKKNLNSSDFFKLSSAASSAAGSSVASSSPASSSTASSGTANSASASSAAANSAAGAAVSASGNTSSAGEGGEDLDAVVSGNVLVPPKSASLGPVKLSVVPLWPVNGEITSGFGYRINPITHKLSFHTGIDIGAAKGTPILAAITGTVEAVGKNDAYGNYILLLHGNGVETFYGHCDTVIMQKGDFVRAGTEIATVGTTGMSTGYHLHFEVRVNKVDYNPKWLLEQ